MPDVFENANFGYKTLFVLYDFEKNWRYQYWPNCKCDRHTMIPLDWVGDDDVYYKLYIRMNNFKYEKVFGKMEKYYHGI